MHRPTIERMLKFSSYAVKLSCGHTLTATAAEVAALQYFIGKAVDCKECVAAATRTSDGLYQRCPQCSGFFTCKAGKACVGMTAKIRRIR